MYRLGRAALVAVLVLFVAVTPLSAIFRPGYFDAQWPSTGHDLAPPPHFVLEDQTGLVAGFVPAAQERTDAVPTRSLSISWLGGCDEQLVYLTFYASGGGYAFEKRTTTNGCPFLVGIRRTVILALRAPVDPVSVRFIGDWEEPRAG
jgi:hypothetical protein